MYNISPSIRILIKALGLACLIRWFVLDTQSKRWQVKTDSLKPGSWHMQKAKHWTRMTNATRGDALQIVVVVPVWRIGRQARRDCEKDDRTGTLYQETRHKVAIRKDRRADQVVTSSRYWLESCDCWLLLLRWWYKQPRGLVWKGTVGQVKFGRIQNTIVWAAHQEKLSIS
jgi:hypothetical protein